MSLRGRYGYTGREEDVETGWQYNRARYYDSVNARWISQDPLGFDAGDSNLYRYVKNSVTAREDPSGRLGDGPAPNYYTLKEAEDIYKNFNNYSLDSAHVRKMLAQYPIAVRSPRPSEFDTAVYIDKTLTEHKSLDKIVTGILINDLLINQSSLSPALTKRIEADVVTQDSEDFPTRDSGWKDWENLYSNLPIAQKPMARTVVRHKFSQMQPPALELKVRVEKMLTPTELIINQTYDMRILYSETLFIAYYVHDDQSRYLSITAPLMTGQFEDRQIERLYRVRFNRLVPFPSSQILPVTGDKSHHFTADCN
jgi:RHS repeat-associated protein